jgi:hypothetical protein
MNPKARADMRLTFRPGRRRPPLWSMTSPAGLVRNPTPTSWSSRPVHSRLIPGPAPCHVCGRITTAGVYCLRHRLTTSGRGYGSRWQRVSHAARCTQPRCSVLGCTVSDLTVDHPTMAVLCPSHHLRSEAIRRRIGELAGPVSLLELTGDDRQTVLASQRADRPASQGGSRRGS